MIRIKNLHIILVLYPLISSLHFFHEFFVPWCRILLYTALSTNKLYILWQVRQALILVNGDSLAFSVNPMVTFNAVNHFRLKIIIRIAFVAERAEVVRFSLNATVLAMCKFKHPHSVRILQRCNIIQGSYYHFLIFSN